MGVDVFGVPRFQCQTSGCDCVEFVSQAQLDQKSAEDAEDSVEAVELLEGYYHGLTCQAKSEYQLVCATCKHSATFHSRSQDRGRPKDEDGRAVSSSVFVQGFPCSLKVVQGVVFRKNGASPDAGKIVKLARPVGALLQASGRSWQGPSGGLWAELDAAAGSQEGWVLIEGPGFGVEGPLLQQVSSEPATAELPPPDVVASDSLSRPRKEGPLTDRRARELLSTIHTICSSPEFQEKVRDPLAAGDLFIGACAGPAADFGFGTGEDSLQKMFAAVKKFDHDYLIQQKIERIEEALQLEAGSLLALAEDV